MIKYPRKTVYSIGIKKECQVIIYPEEGKIKISKANKLDIGGIRVG